MPSASTTGKPHRAAHATGSSPLDPPISADISATTFLPHSSSTYLRITTASPPCSIFSIETTGAPIPPQGMISSSSPRSSRSTTGTGPWSSTACRAMSRPKRVSPPPPADRIAHPRANAGRFV